MPVEYCYNLDTVDCFPPASVAEGIAEHSRVIIVILNSKKEGVVANLLDPCSPKVLYTAFHVKQMCQ